MDKNQNVAKLLKSIAHPIRIQIIRIIFEHNVLSVSEIQKLLCIDQPIISLHLGVLRKQGIIKAQKKGKSSHYFIVNNSVNQVIEIIYNDCRNN